MLLLDTHAWAWALTGEPLLSPRARQAMDEAEVLILSPVSIYEIAQKVRLGKRPQMAKYVDRLPELAQEQSVFIAPITAELALAAGQLDWLHRDPFDRHLAATAMLFDLDLVSVDSAFDTLSGLRRIW